MPDSIWCDFVFAINFDVKLEHFYDRGFIKNFKLKYDNETGQWVDYNNHQAISTGLVGSDNFNVSAIVPLESFIATRVKIVILPDVNSYILHDLTTYRDCTVSGRFDVQISKIDVYYTMPYQLGSGTEITSNSECLRKASKLGLQYAAIHNGNNCYGGNNYPTVYD